MVKKITTLGNLDIVHVFDFEESQNEEAFKNTLNAMKSAAKLKKKVKYSLGYSNYTFDLWIILHKSCMMGRKSQDQIICRLLIDVIIHNLNQWQNTKKKLTLKEC